MHAILNVVSIAVSSLLYLAFLPIYVILVLLNWVKSIFSRTQQFKPRSVLITGASSGIGEEIAYHYASPGVKLIIVGRNEDRLNNVRAKCERLGSKVVICKADVGDRQSMDQIIEQQETLDLVIANAGVSEFTVLRDRDQDILHKVAEEDKLTVEEEDVLRDVINTNLNGVLNTVYPAVRYFLSHNKNKVSQIAIVSSLMGSVPIIGGTYGCTKSFVINLGHVLRTTYAKNNIRVNVVLPGWVESRMADAFPGAKAFIMSSSSAAAVIKSGLTNDRAVIDFPTIAAFGLDILSRLPIAFLTEVSRYMGGARSFVKKSVQDKLLKK